MREVSPEGRGKLSRATAAIILAESGQIYLMHGQPWVRPFVDECVQFTGLNDLHDDQVDALAYAVRMLPMVVPEPVPKRVIMEHSSTRPSYHSDAAARIVGKVKRTNSALTDSKAEVRARWMRALIYFSRSGKPECMDGCYLLIRCSIADH